MIMGDCPYEDCDGPLWIPVADVCPAYERHTCETCGRVIWTRHSRWDPWSMTEADFLAEYDVNDETRKISKRTPETPHV